MMRKVQSCIPRTGADDYQVLRAAFEHAPVGVGICDENGIFVAANDSLGRLVNQWPEQLIGRPFLSFVHPDERAASLACYFRSVVAAAAGNSVGDAERTELRCITEDGSVIWLEVTWTVSEPDADQHQYAIVHMSDISERKYTKRRLAEVNRRLELAFTHAPIGIAVVAMDGRVLQSNTALQAMLGCNDSQLEHLVLEDITHPEDRHDTATVIEQLLSGALDAHDTVKRYLRSNGSIGFARRVTAAVRTPDGRSRYLLVQMEDVTGEWQARAELRERALRDPLTKLATHESLAYELEISHSARGLVVVELSEMSRLRGALGGAAGDQASLAVAQRLTASCRAGDVVARLGTDEFAILLDDPSEGVLAGVAQRVVAALHAPILIDQIAVTISVRAGAVADPDGTQSLDSMLQQAELALHTNTSNPDLSWAQYEPTMHDASARRLTIESDLRSALDRGDLTLHYQPIVDLDTGRLRTVEALSRWTHQAFGEVPPEEFVAAAERTGLIDEFTTYTLNGACHDLAEWRKNPAGRELAIAVNISPSCMANPNFPAIVAGCLADAGVPADRLILEITETALSHADTAFLANANLLHSRGIRIALDDFGAGQSSLSRLARFPITDIKLDRSFIEDIVGPEDDAPLVRASIGMANEINMTLTAEGVETQVQLDLLRRYGCPQVQGYFISRPQPAARITELLGAGGHLKGAVGH
jgi:PAS domain S-box-containing protein/diguanylate cyclase (GGDEF)-like protein